MVFQPTPETRATRGFAIGMNFLVVGVEFEYANTREKERVAAPGLATSMFNGIVSTPTTGIQFYGTLGGGIYRERFGDETETSFGTNIGGGAKVTLAGPHPAAHRLPRIQSARRRGPQDAAAFLRGHQFAVLDRVRSHGVSLATANFASPMRSIRTVALLRLS